MVKFCMNNANSQHQADDIKVKIGDWLLYPSLNRLERGNDTVHLEPKAVAVLELLVRHGGQPVPRQELLDHIWGNTIVSDDALTQVIIKLRKALGDNSRKPDYIQTIPKRGYRLLAPVQLISEVPPSSGNHTRRLYIFVVSGMLLFICIFFLTSIWLTEESGEQSISKPLLVATPMSISVLPFEAVGQKQESLPFALGISADLTTDLSKLSGLRVIHISDAEKDKQYSRYIVTGSVQQLDDKLKLHVKLVDSETRQQLWAERFSENLDEIFDVQQSISEEIVKQLSIKVSNAEKKRLAKRYTRNLTAYEDFLSGQAELLRREKFANVKARELYRQAIKSDPGFARAYAGLALSYAADFRNQWVDDGALSLIKAREMAETAIQIDPSISQVHWVIGYVDTQIREHDRALQALERAIQLDPSYSDAYALMGGINTYRGNPDETLGLLREAIWLRPNAGFLYYLLLGRAYFFLGDYEQALINLEETIDRNPESLEAHIYLAAASVAIGDVEAAKWEADEIESLSPDFDLSKWFRTYPMSDTEQIKDLTAKLKIIGF